MLCYERKGNNSKECMISHYSLFKFRHSIDNGCHDMTMLSNNIKDITIIIVKDVNCRCNMHYISKSEAINSLKNYVLADCGYV